LRGGNQKRADDFDAIELSAFSSWLLAEGQELTAKSFLRSRWVKKTRLKLRRLAGVSEAGARCRNPEH